jgi:hypothetical protein
LATGTSGAVLGAAAGIGRGAAALGLARGSTDGLLSFISINYLSISCTQLVAII